MEEFLDFFQYMPVGLKLGWAIFCMGFFWLLEGYYKQFHLRYKKWKHARINLALLGFVMLINVAFGLATAKVFIELQESHFGLLNLFHAPIWVKLVLSLLALDLIAQYGVHYVLHKVRWLWRLHLVHHTDKNVDVTTGTRHHPLDFLLRELFALLAVVIMGMPVAFYFFYRILSILFTYWTHANVKLPLWIDKGLTYIIVTPNMHKFHHHHQLPWTDSNYGNMLSIWDRIFGTFVYGDPNKIKYGVDVADHMEDENLGVQLGMPFSKKIKSSR
jgi:sterol desaturase/sphingolipid hydroxylase (fatty acid hydroxylase superfamily)